MSPLALTLLVSLAGLNPFEKNQPEVDDGMAAYERGDFEEALRHFEAAEKALPQSPQVPLDRALALHKLGRHEEALSALNRAGTLDHDGALKGDIAFTRGNVHAAMEQRDEAVKAYRQALKVDANDERARHNLEVLLKKLPPKTQQPQKGDGGTDGGQNDGGRPDGGSDGGRPDGGQDGGQGDGGRGDAGTDGGSPDGGPGDGGQSKGPNGDGGTDGGRGDGGQGEQPGKKGDGGQENEQKRDGGERSDGGEQSDGGADPSEGGNDQAWRDGGASLTPAQAEKLLDSMKSSEKNLQLWRFQQKRTKAPDGKDW